MNHYRFADFLKPCIFWNKWLYNHIHIFALSAFIFVFAYSYIMYILTCNGRVVNVLNP